MNPIRIADPAEGGSKSQNQAPQRSSELSKEDLLKENGLLKARITSLESDKAKVGEREKAIAEKMAHGLSRQQAISVLDRQDAHDIQRAKEKAEKEAAAKAAAAKK